MNLVLQRTLVGAGLWLIATLSGAALPAEGADGKPFPSLAPMLKAVNPAVVNIATYSTQQYSYNPLLNDPFFRHFFNVPRGYQQPKKRQQSAGSGVIVNAEDGIILTNYHVIKDADQVQVSLVDGRSFAAKVRGTDPELDVAVLQIEARQLTAVPTRSRHRLEVGDFVVAIGNPFGLGQTVTTGIVSALGRSGLGMDGFENFIQTDASINPGNSGGALVNLAGELVGINTAIIAPAGGNVGIGFAIPTAMALASMEQILTHGAVRRGHLGLSAQDISSDLRSAFNLPPGQHGALVVEVYPNSTAEAAGLRAGDIIVAVDAEPVHSKAQLLSLLAVKAIDDQVQLTLLREGREHRLTARIETFRLAHTDTAEIHPLLAGLELENAPDNQGVWVTGMVRNAPAAFNGLRPGDVIVAVNKYRVKNLRELSTRAAAGGPTLLLQIVRNGRSYHVQLR
ncbi:Do family serine endopeptidase [Simiduia sp. 21SJ11W-1]|uniref:Do family serine endopeptidase n=1 Tax=Simiduia sp. 21SJ11W-1 TaxID=2909669 RepID=UPI00209DAE1B|nr:Do family serine endopeptidase [Simiduia sp. 21SJ11W-1]UTA47051.1 Do family serine endopeptidase [Simiduia sp. 21SJ11W-1]